MLRARFNSKNALKFLSGVLLVVLTSAPALAAPSIDLSLNVLYTTPANPNSGGTWELVAKTNSDGFGLAGLSALLTNVTATANNLAPHALVNGATANLAGFGFVTNSPGPGTSRNITLGQAAALPGSGPDQTAFYGVGTLTNGAPNYPAKPAGSNSIGPAFTTLTSPAGIAWATGDTFADPAWATAAKLASGTFIAGVTPGFFLDPTDKSLGSVFTSIGTSMAFGTRANNIVASTIVRTNLAANPANGDYNLNGVVDAADYVVWRNTFGLTSPLNADGNLNGTIDAGDYDVWKANFGKLITGSGNALGAAAVPEPCGALLLAIGITLAFSRRTRRPNSENPRPAHDGGSQQARESGLEQRHFRSK